MCDCTPNKHIKNDATPYHLFCAKDIDAILERGTNKVGFIPEEGDTAKADEVRNALKRLAER